MSAVPTDPSRATLVQLPDGRYACVQETGPLDGRPVVLCHGGGHSRLFRHPGDVALAQAGVRLITVDRPGIGRSTPNPQGTIAGWSADLAAVADGLGVDRFSLIGHSMGGPFATAAAHDLGDRIDTLVLAGPLPPLDRAATFAGLDAFNRRIYRVARRSPLAMVVPLALMMRRRARDPQAFQQRYYADAPAADRAVATDPVLGQVLLESAGEAAAQGPRGLARELTLMTRPWDIAAVGLSAQARLLFGEHDSVVGGPTAQAAWREILPDAEFEQVPGGGHLLPLSHWDRVLRAAS
ncbi:MAG: alpha/beta hydrolase [Solirubrobacteraceae bacterium]|nr:alpha/beta hydrolase [Solirubrobacteraceae bacterium]